VGVDEGDRTLSVHPCHALFVAGKQQVQKSIQQTHIGEGRISCQGGCLSLGHDDLSVVVNVLKVAYESQEGLVRLGR